MGTGKGKPLLFYELARHLQGVGASGKTWHGVIRLGSATPTPKRQFITFTDLRQNKAMKTSITSNLRPLLRAFQAFLIAIAGLWRMPRNAHAQLYVIRGSKTGIVSEYDAKTGVAINASFITGLTDPFGLAVKSAK